jgi:hypothetical protein
VRRGGELDAAPTRLRISPRAECSSAIRSEEGRDAEDNDTVLMVTAWS